MTALLIVIRLVLLLSLTLLQACQQNTERLIRVQKQNDAATYNTQLGLAYLKQGDRPRAKRKLLAALELAQDSAEANAAMAYYLETTGDVSKARIFYKKAISLAPHSGSQLNNYGTFLCRQGKYKEAEAYFLSAINDVHYINTAGAYENAGLCVAAIPDYLRARGYFIKALEQDPQRKQSLYELASIELKQNHTVKALKDLQKYPELTWNNKELLTLALKAAHRLGDLKLEAAYQQHLNKYTDNTGANNEYDSDNG